MAKIVINRTQKTAQYYVEDLGNGITLDIVLIPGGSFMMGSPEDELEHRESESPQHLVNIKQFCIGKYPITQEQWKAVVALPQVQKELDPDPSHFKGDKRPVERVSWYDAVEFCDRLTSCTKRQYRLPSEAEWEYACRAGTTTPFHFGETITTDVANYRGTDNEEFKWLGSYGRGSKGIYQGETTEVGSFEIANAFGLYDMHGNVLEWCSDHWYMNYNEAPTDGRAWINNNNQRLLLRGGSWYSNPHHCRSAFRFNEVPNYYEYYIGFRVVCDGEAVRLQDDLSSGANVDYTKQRNFLKARKWQEADNKTYNDKPIIVRGVAVISFKNEDNDGNITNKTIEITPDDLDWEVDSADERQMGTETAYAATYYFDRGQIEWTVWEYPMGVTNYSDYRIEGGTLVTNFDSLEVNNEEPY